MGENVDRLGVRAADEFAVAHELQPLDQALIDKAVQKVHFLRAFLEHRGNDVFHHFLLKIHILLQRRKRDFRLDHPELGGVARRIRFFSAERRAKGVDVAERLRKDFRVQLTRNSQRHRLSEEIPRVIDLAVLRHRERVGIERGHAEHLARALAVAAGNQRGVHIEIALVVEEAMNGLRGGGAHAEGALEQVRPGAQVLNGAQVFQRVALLLQGIVHRAFADHGDGLGLQLEGLLHVGREHQRAGEFHGRAQSDLPGQLAIIGQLVRLQNHLKVPEIASVVQLDEGEGFGLAHRAHPAVDRDVGQVRRRHFRIELLNENVRHENALLSI